MLTITHIFVHMHTQTNVHTLIQTHISYIHIHSPTTNITLTYT